MNSRSKGRWLSISVGGALLMVAIFYGLVWNEARKEIVFLCPNFQSGVSQQSVLRQLETGNLLRYQIKLLPVVSKITVDSVYNFGFYTCVIELDQERKVIESHLE